MGNDYKLCHTNTIQQTNLCVEVTEIREVVSLIQTVHKTIDQFLEDNSDFFDQDCIAIKHILLLHPEFEEQLNRFPIQRVNEKKRVFLPNLTKEEFSLYEGECLFLDFKSFELYLGHVKYGKKSGSGIMINKHGNKYEGNWAHDMQNGQGTLQILYPKRTYKGNWKNNKLDGKGQATYEDGAKYDGIFYLGKKNGMGILTFHDGAVYEGSFQADLMHGFGTLTSIKGKEISGEWKYGKYQVSKPERTSRTFSINELPAM